MLEYYEIVDRQIRSELKGRQVKTESNRMNKLMNNLKRRQDERIPEKSEI